jgi:hypothetical protein
MIKNTLKNMTQLDIWIQINQIYNISKPKGLIQSYIIKANIPTNMLLIGIILSPTITGLLLLENKYFYLWMILVLVLYFTLIVIFSDKILQNNYTNNAIYDFPILQRRLYLHYACFKNNCDLRLGFINQVDMHRLIEWHKQSIKPLRFHKHCEAKIQAFLTMYLQDKKNES